MEYDEFKKMFMEEVEHEIKARIIEGVTISNEEIRSPEGMTDRLIVKMENSNISMAFRLQEIYEDYDGRLEVQVEGLVDTIQENMNVREKEADVKSFIMDFDKAKDHLHLRLIPGDSPALSDTPHVMIEDMALVANLDIVGFAEDGRTCAIICDALLAHYGISKDELFEIARDNSIETEPLKFEALEHKVASLLQEDDIYVPVDMNNTAFIATNTSGFNGASVIAYPDFNEKAVETMGGSFYMIPSSVHEFILIKDDGMINAKTLNAMIRDVNKNTLKPKDRLSSQCYHYDAKTKKLEQGLKFDKRIKEKKVGAR